jgi:hypothetical protein
MRIKMDSVEYKKENGVWYGRTLIVRPSDWFDLHGETHDNLERIIKMNRENKLKRILKIK